MTPKEITQEMVEISKKKVSYNWLTIILLGILGGMFIALGSELSMMGTFDLPKFLGTGFSKIMAGSLFSVGLILVVMAGADLFTGNILIITGVLAKQVKVKQMIRNWLIIYFTNLIGALIIVAIMYYSNLWNTNDYAMGGYALMVATKKASLGFWEALVRGIACNWLVCLGVWLGVAGKDAVSKIIGIYVPVMAFVASGFEHAIANMYFLPFGLLMKANDSVVTASKLGSAVDHLNWYNVIVNNFIPVTIGNIIGGALFVGAFYYWIYLKPNKA